MFHPTASRKISIGTRSLFHMFDAPPTNKFGSCPCDFCLLRRIAEAWRSARDTPNNRAAAFSFRESAWQTQPHRYRYQPHQHHSAHAPARDDGSSWRSSGNNTVEASLPPSTDRARYPDKNAVGNNHRQQIDGTAVVSSKGWTDQSVVVTNAVGGWTGSAAHTTNEGLQNERPGDAIPCGDFPAASPPGADAVVRGSDGWRGGGGVLKAAGGAGGMASILETHAEVAGEEEEDEENGEELEFVLTPEWAEHFRSSPSLQRYRECSHPLWYLTQITDDQCFSPLLLFEFKVPV